MAGEAGSTLWSVQNARRAGSRLVSPACCASGEGCGGMMLRRPVPWLKRLACRTLRPGPALARPCREPPAQPLFWARPDLPESCVIAFGATTLAGHRPQCRSDTLEDECPAPCRGTFSG